MSVPAADRTAPRNPALSSRAVLFAGFGGLLIMMLFAEFDGIRALQQMQASNNLLRQDFIVRTRVLERIRGDLYVSGTYFRDYLLEPEDGKAEGHRDSLLETRADMDAALREYRGFVTPKEEPAFRALTGELRQYWDVMEPALAWSPERRRQDSYSFVQEQVFPRREAMLRAADQIGAIDETQLSEGIAKAQRLFSEYRRRLAITIALTVGLGIALAFFSIGRILNLERAMADSYREISKAGAELQRLSASLVSAQENERRSISRELHDEVGQSLTGVLVEMANLSTAIRAGDDAAVSAKADEIKKLVEGSLAVVRNMALLIRPSMLDDLGLAPALQWQAREISKRSGLRVKVAAEYVSEDLPEEHRTCIYRVAQEALNNTVRHSGASSAKVTVTQQPGRILLSVEDDGKGFDPGRERGLGLIGIQERVANLGGKFTVDSTEGRGATLTVSLPLEAKT